jgi:hypothetical protein
MRSDRYLALTATQHRQLRDALQERRRNALRQSGSGVHSGRGMFEQQDMPQGLHNVRIYVRKHGDKPGYYTSLAAMAGEQHGGAAGRRHARVEPTCSRMEWRITQMRHSLSCQRLPQEFQSCLAPS